MTPTSRIAKNTLFLYFRQILIVLVSLYTVRVVLATLGAEESILRDCNVNIPFASSLSMYEKSEGKKL